LTGLIAGEVEAKMAFVVLQPYTGTVSPRRRDEKGWGFAYCLLSKATFTTDEWLSILGLAKKWDINGVIDLAVNNLADSECHNRIAPQYSYAL